MASDEANGKGFFMLQVKSLSGLPISTPGTRRSSFMGQILLRVLAVGFTLAAISVMITSSESVTLFGFRFTARYSYSSSLRFLLGADVAVCCFSILSLISVMMLLMMSGCVAASAVGYVSKYGEEKIGWMAVCDHVNKFCDQMLLSLVFSYLTFFSYLSLTIMAVTKLMAKSTD
ncbi:CASP-like protein 1F2 isoform X2 [Carica papaya]|uniref:CASP-like protein 1F2 isoform X2 n=1 Tax=Carica papaya TaxID=3649 RepID=UPI000B8CD5D5|nr:CASP-like protein 1F2 isoform X2 [Carica papaya]